MNKHFDPQWHGQQSKIKRTETPCSYVTIVFTDVVYLEYNRILLQLIDFYNSKECLALQTLQKNRIFTEIQRMTKMLNENKMVEKFDIDEVAEKRYPIHKYHQALKIAFMEGFAYKNQVK